MAVGEVGPTTFCFNGDFNWFDVADATFVEINRRLLRHDAIVGNVEAELDTPSDDTGCGRAYPDDVDQATVERSNQIHQMLKATAVRQPELLARIARVPMFRRYRVAALTVGVVHGDAESLAGWRFDVAALADPPNDAWLQSAMQAAEVDVFASSHTCLPALRQVELSGAAPACVVNNGAAGMPNFADDLRELCSRVGADPSPYPVIHERRIIGAACVALLRVDHDASQWRTRFLQQ